MLAEAFHSFADSLNEVLLAVSLRRGRAPADAAHPFGHGRERFLWAFMAAVASFLIGGCLSIALSIRELIEGGTQSNFLLAGVVLAVAFGADGLSLVQSLRPARREAQRRGQSLWNYVLRTSDPTLRAVIAEDSAALVGLGLASLGLVGSAVFGNGIPDALASLLIGLLLAATAFGLGWPISDLLLGRSVPAEQLQQIQAILAASPAVEEVLVLQAVYTGPEEAIVAAKVRPLPTLTMLELTRAMDEVDHALRSALPEVADVYIDVTAFRSDSSSEH